MAVIVAVSALPVCAQRGGSHGGFSGPHAGGFSAPHGGFSGGHAGFSAPSFHGGSGTFVRGGPPRFSGGLNGARTFSPQPPSVRPPSRFGGGPPGTFAGPPQYISHRMPYSGTGLRPVAPVSPVPRQSGLGSVSHRMPYTGPGSRMFPPASTSPRSPGAGVSHRMPYHSPHNPDRGDSGNHGGSRDHHDGDHRHHDWDHHHHGYYYTYYGWVSYPYWPWWGWGYPYLPAYWDSWDNYDPQPASNYGVSQYPEYNPVPYDEPPSDQPQQQPESAPYSRPAPSNEEPSSASPDSPPATITLVFKDGRPNQQIRNYLLTAKTLSVLDSGRRDIPVDQIDLPATARLNGDAGNVFALPSR